ncbi:iron-sulfur cluster co-chaperone protein HscB homolog [Rhododendron vialii]|uniref:iron-sulfur cluster co-chaperone protein HscB homolog n=1 Tax=Rhododendron vialii TaxID=182163 RepID=UPI00265F8D8A|nr:iron-sulfur cluster co-chaperone protein HscB homolog [Rhododendron vialii]XP_058204411.1 iron-sulfur cluster co-chaperone protein HscB homolog [Rhododendron vialii]XP_058204412.1 iron-sulfur cluster co-chaperone protein HscB homolog [Rhododendron vialii]
MWKRNLRSPLSTLLYRQPLPSLSPLLCTHSPSAAHPLTAFPPFHSLPADQENRASDFPFHRFHYPRNLNLSWSKNFSSGIVVNQCWSCASLAAQTVPFLVCEICRCVQPVDPFVDYFQIFGLEKQYVIEEENLEGRYKNWQKKLHPDLVHSKSEKEKECAAEQSARVIDAYRTLGDPLSRAIYILKLEGVDVDEEETISEPELLAEILEIREAVEEAGDTQALSQIQIQIKEKFQHSSESFATAFQSRKFEEARASIRRMTYYKRVNEEIVKKL